MSKILEELEKIEKMMKSQPWPKDFTAHVIERSSALAEPVQREDGTYICPSCNGRGAHSIMDTGSDGRQYVHGERECDVCSGWGSV